MPTYYLTLCSGYIRLLYRLYKLIIIIIIYCNIYIYIYIHICCLLHVIHTPSSQILNGGDGSKHAGRGCSCLRPAKNSGEGRQTWQFKKRRELGAWWFGIAGILTRGNFLTEQKRRIWTAAVEVHNMQSVVTKHLAGFRALTSISWCGAWNMTLLRKWPKKHETNGRSNGTHWFWGINPWLRTQTWIELLF